MNKLSVITAIRRTSCALFSVACFLTLVIGSSSKTHAADQAPAAMTPAAAPEQTQPSTAAQAQQSAPEAKKKDDRLISLVLLLSKPRKPTHDVIAHAVSEGIGVKIGTAAVIDKPPYHLVNVGRDKFIINDIAKPYFEQSAKVADEIKNPKLSRAVRDHRAWISVDWVSTGQQADLRQVYQMIGKMVVHLSHKDTEALAVYSPDMDQFALWVPTVRKGLASDDPLAVFEPAQAAAPSPRATASP